MRLLSSSFVAGGREGRGIGASSIPQLLDEDKKLDGDDMEDDCYVRNEIFME